MTESNFDNAAPVGRDALAAALGRRKGRLLVCVRTDDLADHLAFTDELVRTLAATGAELAEMARENEGLRAVIRSQREVLDSGRV